MNATPQVRRAGRSGLWISEIGLGCNNFGMKIDESAARDVVRAALDAGVTFFDTADIYSDGESESILGRCLGAARDEVVISTKFGARPGPEYTARGASRAAVKRACEASLRRLNVDAIDLYNLHKPDPYTPLEETILTVDELIREGKVRHFAFSNLAGWQIADLVHLCEAHPAARPVAAQIEWNLLKRETEKEVNPACGHFGISTVAYFPLASGLLTGKYAGSDGFPQGTRLAELPAFSTIATPANKRLVDELTEFSAQRGRTLLELAVSWLLGHSGLSSVLTGATSAEQVRQNTAAGSWKLSPQDQSDLQALLNNEPETR